MRHKTRERSLDGFTLIEILVVISIIIILAAILFPVFSRARESARRVSCASSMKQLALSVMMYTQDYDGRLMPRDNGVNPFNRMTSYIKNAQILRCPSGYPYKAGDSLTSRNYPLYGFPSNGTAAAHNRYVTALVAVTGAYSSTGTPKFSGPIAIDQFPDPSLTCLLGETRYPLDLQYERDGYGVPEFYASADAGYDRKFFERARHFDGSNYAYADGHVKWIKKSVVEHVYDVQQSNATHQKGATEAQAAQLPIVFAWQCPGRTSGGGWSNSCY